MSELDKVILKSTGAIGDTVIASALQEAFNVAGIHTGIISKDSILNLWEGLENVSMYSFEDELPEDVWIVDISNYSVHMPHSKDLPFSLFEEHQRGHLCQWMAYDSHIDGIPFEVANKITKNGVRVVLTRKEIEEGRDTVWRVSQDNGNKPIVIFNPYSANKNRSLPVKKLEDVVAAVKDFAVPCLLDDFQEHPYVEGMVLIGDRNLRKVSAILLASDVYVGIDGGPLHMVNGVIQGTPTENYVEGISTNPEKVIAVLGSSGEKVVVYDYNQVIFGTGGCFYAPCGAHGYQPIDEYGERFKDVFYPSDNPEKDKGGCIYYSHTHPNIDSAVCMQSIPAELIIQTIRDSMR